MAENKKYYWLKLKSDFFEEKYVKALRKLPQGDSLTIVYLKMQLKSLKTEGIIKYEGILPNSISELSLVLDEDENIVQLAVSALLKFGIIEQWENDTLYMRAMQQLIGSETDSAERVRRHRALHCNTKMLQSNSTVTKCNTEIEIEKRDKKEDIELDKNICPDKQDKNVSFPKPIRHKYGEYKNVLLSDDELSKLKNEFPNDWEERIENLSEYIESTGKKYKNHLATIRSWAKRECGKRGENNGTNKGNTKPNDYGKIGLEL